MTVTQEAATLRQIEANVLGKGYTSIDYNLMVFQSGNIWEGRGWQHEDAATLGWNQDSISVCAVGNFQEQQPTLELLDSLGHAVWLAAQGDWLVDHPTILGHRDSGFPTACPGNNLYARLNNVRSAFNSAGSTPPEEDSVEHGMAVDFKINPKIPTQGYVLDRWGGIHPFGGAAPALNGPYWSGLDVARKIEVTDWIAGKGYVLDLNGAAHPFGGAPQVQNTPYWKSGKIVPFGET